MKQFRVTLADAAATLVTTLYTGTEAEAQGFFAGTRLMLTLGNVPTADDLKAFSTARKKMFLMSDEDKVVACYVYDDSAVPQTSQITRWADLTHNLRTALAYSAPGKAIGLAPQDIIVTQAGPMYDVKIGDWFKEQVFGLSDGPDRLIEILEAQRFPKEEPALPAYVQAQDGNLYRVTGLASKGGGRETPYQGVDLHGNVCFNLFPSSVKPVTREKVLAFLGE